MRNVANSTVILDRDSGLVPNPPERLSRKQRTVIAYIEHNPKFAAFATTAELGARTGVHPSTIVRLSQLLGYPGFPEFQEALRHRYLNSLDAIGVMDAYSGAHHSDVVLASLDQDIRNLSATRSTLDRDAVRQIAAIIQRARSVLIVGAGSHAGIAIIFSHLCRFMGYPVDAEIRGGVALAARISNIGSDDVIIGTAAWLVVHETRESIAFARERGAATVAIVDSRASALAQVADHVLVTRTESVSFYQSMIGPLTILNALIAELAASAETDAQERMRTSNALFDRFGIAWHQGAADFERTLHDDGSVALTSSQPMPG